MCYIPSEVYRSIKIPRFSWLTSSSTKPTPSFDPLQHNSSIKRALLVQCCNPSHGTLLFRWIWSTESARYLCICPATQPLYQGTEKPEKRGQKSCLPSGAPNLACGAQGCEFDSQVGGLLFTSSILR